MNIATLATARRAALLEPLTRAELVQLGQILTRGVRRAGNLAGTVEAHSWHKCNDFPPLSECDQTATELTDILSDDVLGMLLNA